MRHILISLLLFVIGLAINTQKAWAQAEDATALEAQYKTCAKHYIPAEKCTSEIYQQIKKKDEAPLDPQTATVLKAGSHRVSDE